MDKNAICIGRSRPNPKLPRCRGEHKKPRRSGQSPVRKMGAGRGQGRLLAKVFSDLGSLVQPRQKRVSVPGFMTFRAQELGSFF